MKTAFFIFLTAARNLSVVRRLLSSSKRSSTFVCYPVVVVRFADNRIKSLAAIIAASQLLQLA